jgi:hypothetical protein
VKVKIKNQIKERNRVVNEESINPSFEPRTVMAKEVEN